MKKEDLVRVLDMILKDIALGNDVAEYKDPFWTMKQKEKGEWQSACDEDDVRHSRMEAEALNRLFWNYQNTMFAMDILLDAFHQADLTEEELQEISHIIAEGIKRKRPELFGNNNDLCGVSKDDLPFDPDSIKQD